MACDDQVSMDFAITMKPKVVLCENVPGILHAEHRGVFTNFLGGLIRSGYQLRSALMVAVRAAILHPVIPSWLRSFGMIFHALHVRRVDTVFRAVGSA